MTTQLEQISKRDVQAALMWAVGIAVFTYIIFITQHMTGNHALRLPWLHQSEQIANGRWVTPLLGHLHYDADVPAFMPVFGIGLGAAAILFAAAGWRLTQTKIEHIAIFTIALVFPMNLSFFYYSFMTPLFFISNFFAVAAIFVLSKGGVARLLAASVSILFLLGSYQAAISIFGVLTFAWPIAHLLRNREDDTKSLIKDQIGLMLWRIAAAGLGGILYLGSLKWFNVPDSQTLELNSLADLIDRLWLVISTAFDHLTVTQPDFLAPLKFALLGILLAAILASLLYLRKKPLIALSVGALWIAMVVSTKAIFLISDPSGSIYEYRYNSALGFVHVFSFAVLFFILRSSQMRFVQYATLALSFIVISTMVQADLVRQSVLKRGEAHDLATANRILARIEQLDDFDPSQTYDFIRIGRYSTFRYNLYRAGDWKIDRAGDGHMDFGELTDRWVDEDVFRLLGARIRFEQKSTDPRFVQKYAAVMDSGILDNRQAWPAESSVFISGNRIIVLMEKPKRAPIVSTRNILLDDGNFIDAKFEPVNWSSTDGGQSSFQIENQSLIFAAGQGGVSVDALRAWQGEQFRLIVKGEILDPGTNDVPLRFAFGPVFLDARGNVSGWWNSDVGREAVESASADGTFTMSRDIVTPPGSASAHIAFYGPYSPDGVVSDGRIKITDARLERVQRHKD